MNPGFDQRVAAAASLCENSSHSQFSSGSIVVISWDAVLSLYPLVKVKGYLKGNPLSLNKN